MSEEIDREIDVRRLALFGIGLTALVVLASVAMWFFLADLRSRTAAADPPPPALAEARLPQEIAGPRLQTDPTAEMAALRARERELLEGWGWVDRAAGIARVPVEVGMDLLLAHPPAPAASPPSEPTRDEALP